MKKTLKYFASILAGILVFGSCSTDKLEPVPKTNISDLSAFETKARIVNQVNGLYTAVRSGQFLGGRYHVYNDIRSDEFLNSTTNGVTGYLIWGHTVDNGENNINGLWNQVYASINRINVFIDGLTGSGAVGSGLITQDEYDQFVGEAKALRAMCFFYLLQMWAQPYNKDDGASLGIPLRIVAEKSSENNNLVRSSVADCYAQILQDLNDAEAGVLADFSTDALDVSRIHLNAVIAFKMRVYLHMGDYANVRTEGAKLVPAAAPYVAPTGVPNTLAATVAGIYNPPYTTRESIFSMPFTATELPGTQNSLASYYSVAILGDYYINETDPNAVWQDNTNWPATDGRRALTTVSGGKRYLNKWYRSPSAEWIPVIRYAEVLLNLAEAEAEVSGVNQRAVDLLNAVRLRADATQTAYVPADFASTAAFVTRCLNERRIEFLGEGMRNMDLHRRMLTIPAKATISSVPTTAGAYIWPIPTNELLYNTLCEDNPQ